MEIRFDESEVIVVDMGTGFIKAGFSGEDLPRVVIPTVVGERENTAVAEDSNAAAADSKPNKVVSKRIGGDAFLNRDEYNLHFPIQKGIVVDNDVDRIGDLLEHVFMNELSIDPKSATVLMTDSPMSRKEDK